MIRDHLHERTGVFLDDGKSFLVEARLAKRVIACNLKSFEDYYYFLKYDRKAADEFHHVVDVLTTHETYFFREYSQVAALTGVLLPRAAAGWPSAKSRQTVRIWSAGCSTGEEPYTIAMALARAGAYLDSEIEILATDISTRVLRSAQRGEYRRHALRETPADVEARFFRELATGEFAVSEEVRSKVTFSVVNLGDPAAVHSAGTFDYIFCRNVLIYFDDRSKRAVAAALYRGLKPGGYLFLGHAESLFRLTHVFELVQFEGCLGYRRPIGSDGLGTHNVPYASLEPGKGLSLIPGNT